MAIISIPTSVGGVTIPGAVVKGPLGALFGNKYSQNNLQYPRDLTSATRGHFIKFSVNEIQPTGYEEGKVYEIKDTFKSVTNSVKSLFDAKDESATTINLSLKPQKKRIVSTISLYMPDTVNFTQNAGYSNLSIKDVAEEIAGATSKVASAIPKIGKFASGVISAGVSIVNSKTTKLALATQGLAINPQQQLLFDGIDFRTYQLAFTFTPYSAEEAKTVTEIIKMFRYHAAPQIVTGDGGMFFVPPSTFNIDFLLNGQRNKNISRVAESVIESIDVNYAPSGWSAHSDGAPVQTTLTINFKEIELIDKTLIQQGF